MKDSEQDKRIKANLLAVDWANTSYEELEDIFEDRDPLEFI